VQLRLQLTAMEHRPTPGRLMHDEEIHRLSVTSLEKRQILVVEDEPLIAAHVEDLLSQAGAKVQVASTANEAQNALRTSHFDAAVLDIHLEDERSYELADALLSQGTPFLFLSGYLTIRAGYEHLPFIAKPFSADRVLAAVEGLVRHPI
jgi:DNA-binding response OmpR family regulator